MHGCERFSNVIISTTTAPLTTNSVPLERSLGDLSGICRLAEYLHILALEKKFALSGSRNSRGMAHEVTGAHRQSSKEGVGYEVFNASWLRNVSGLTPPMQDRSSTAFIRGEVTE